MEDSNEFKQAFLKHELASIERQLEESKLITPKERKEIAKELSEECLDELMESFSWELNSLEDKIDFIKNMLYFYNKLNKED